MSQAARIPPHVPYFSIVDSLRIGWGAFKTYYLQLLLAVVVFVAIAIVASLFESSLGRSLLAQRLVSLAVMLLIGAQLHAGLAYVGVRAARSQKPDLRLLFRGFASARTYWSIAGTQALILVIGAACWAPLAVLVVASGGIGNTPAVLLVVLFTAIAMIYLGVRVGLAITLLVDEYAPPLGPIGAIRLSWRITRGELGRLLMALSVAMALLILATALALVLPAIFFGLPLAVGVWGAAYSLSVGTLRIGPGPFPPTCPACGYDLSGSSGPGCPECGAAG